MVSGGVDSAVCAALLNRALGAEHVIAIHIDNGFMRENESEEVIDSLKNIGLEPKSIFPYYLLLQVTIYLQIYRM
jgi:GMP synthase (glutamine-hydrolysing)